MSPLDGEYPMVAATILAIAVGSILFFGVILPLGLGTIEWIFNIGGTRRRR